MSSVRDEFPIASQRSDDMKIMIVDDSQPLRRMIASFLEDLVDEFVECEDGSQALAAYSEHRPDLVLMDIKMKQMDGFEAATEIKKAFPAARILMLSQWDTSELRDRALRSGAEGYIGKANLLPLRDVIESAF